MNNLKALHERHLLTERCHYNINLKISLQRKAYEEKACRYHIHCLRLLLARKLGQDASWINIMLTFRGNLQQVPPIRNLILVGHDGSVFYMSSGLV